MHSFEISDERVISGPGALARLDELTRDYSNILLMVDRNGFEACGAAGYFEELEKKPHIQGIKKIAYAGKALPITDIEAIYGLIKNDSPPDVIIGIGGGTVMDLAKILAVALSNGCDSANEVLDNEKLENEIPLIFIPTTAGTGSEATTFAVVYRDRVKISVDRKSLRAKHIILDPSLLESLPVPILNATVLDALAQATESAWAVGSTPESKGYSEKAIKTIMANIDSGHNTQRLEALQRGSFWAGKAINISRTTLPHSISYPITAHYGTAHGTAVFLTLPGIAELNYHTIPETKQPDIEMESLHETFSLLLAWYDVESIGQLKSTLTGVMERLGIPTRLREHGIPRDALEFIANNAITKGRSDNNPRDITVREILELLNNIY